MKTLLQIILRIFKHPGVVKLIIDILKTIDEILEDNDNNQKSD